MEKNIILLITNEKVNDLIKKYAVTSRFLYFNFGKYAEKIEKVLPTNNKLINNNKLQYYKIFDKRGEVFKVFSAFYREVQRSFLSYVNDNSSSLEKIIDKGITLNDNNTKLLRNITKKYLTSKALKQQMSR